MIENNSYNLIGRFQIDYFDGEIRWREAQEWQGNCEMIPDMDENNPPIFTDYPQGKGRLVENALILDRANGLVKTDGDAREFYTKLAQLPFWDFTNYIVLTQDEEHIEVIPRDEHVPYNPDDIIKLALLGLNKKSYRSDE